MGLEALGNAVDDLLLAFLCPLALWLSVVGLLVWEAEEGVLVAPGSQGCTLSVPVPKKGAGELQLLHPRVSSQLGKP